MSGIFKTMKANKKQPMSADSLIDKYGSDYFLTVDFDKNGFVKSIFVGSNKTKEEATKDGEK